MVAGAVIGGFLDPSFGVGRPSAALVAGAAISIAVGALVSGRVGLRFRAARSLPAEHHIKAVPSGLLIAAGCVLISRLADFRPGYLFGLVGGLVFATGLKRVEEGRQELIVTAAGLLVVLVAWLGYVPISTMANRADPSFGVQVIDSALAALFIGGIEGLLIGLVPLRLLPGHALLRWKTSVWAVVTFGVAFIFLQVLLRPEAGYLGTSSTASAAVTGALFAGFGIASAAFWGYFQLRPDHPRPTPIYSIPTSEDVQ